MSQELEKLKMYLKTRGLGDFLRKIERHLESTVRGDYFYQPYKPLWVKMEMCRKEQKEISRCLNSKESLFKEDLENLYLSSEEINSIKECLWKKADEWNWHVACASPQKMEYNKNNLRELKEIEKLMGNAHRIEEIENLKRKWKNYSDRDKENMEINNWVRGFSKENKDAYFRTDNSSEKNWELYNNEKYAIKIYCHDDTNKHFHTRKLELIHKLRMGQYISEKEMAELANLFRDLNRFPEHSNQVGIVELGRMNEERGIIKGEAADQVFPEYAQLRDYINTKEKAREVQERERLLNEWDRVSKMGQVRESNPSRNVKKIGMAR